MHIAQGLRTGSSRGKRRTHPSGALELELFALHLWPPFLTPAFQTSAGHIIVGARFILPGQEIRTRMWD